MAIATGGVQQAGSVERDGDIFSDSTQYLYNVPVVDNDTVSVGGGGKGYNNNLL